MGRLVACLAALVASCAGKTVDRAITDAIDVGAPLYNQGKRVACYYVYLRTAEEVVARLGNETASARSIDHSLTTQMQRARPQASRDETGAADGAWTLRNGFDEVRLCIFIGEVQHVRAVTTVDPLIYLRSGFQSVRDIHDPVALGDLDARRVSWNEFS